MLETLTEEPRVCWEPMPGSQTLAMTCPAHIIVYHGSRGPGKTDAQLMRFRMNVGQGFGRQWRGIIFDREYKNLDDLISKSMRWFPEFKDGARFLSSKSDYRWVWPTGEELLFRAIRREADYWGYHGQEFPWIGWNELTKYPDSNLFDLMMSCNRSSFVPSEHRVFNEAGQMIYEPPKMPLEIFATCNPFGAGHNWVKKRFISVAPRGKIVRQVVNVFNPRTQLKEDVVKTQVHIFGSYRENRKLPVEYIADLEMMKDPNRRKAWLEGDWDIIAGGMFDDVWDRSQHVVKPFPIPYSWKIDRSYDHGSSRPFSVGWWAESDGSPAIMPDGTERHTIRGDLFRIAEWYGTSGKPNTGLRMLASAIACGIAEREIIMKIQDRVKPGPADNSIWDENDGKSIGKTMGEKIRLPNGKMVKGIQWTRSNKSPGSRKLGWEECRKMLDDARKFIINDKGVEEFRQRERPGLFVFDTCLAFLEFFPILQRDEKDPDDVDTETEDHIGDEVRYRVLDRRAVTEINMGSAR